VLEFLTRAVRQAIKIKVMQIEKEGIKLSLFPNDMILPLKDSKDSTRQNQTLRSDKHFQQSSTVQYQHKNQ
jgi:hypothetical protein